jgi:hypothetical protein
MALPIGMTQALLLLHGRRCRYCGLVADTADHIIPVHKGGGDDASNLVAACRTCNCSKGTERLPEEIEKELLMEAWIVKGEVNRLARTFAQAQDDARKRPAIPVMRRHLRIHRVGAP